MSVHPSSQTPNRPQPTSHPTDSTLLVPHTVSLVPRTSVPNSLGGYAGKPFFPRFWRFYPGVFFSRGNFGQDGSQNSVALAGQKIVYLGIFSKPRRWLWFIQKSPPAPQFQCSSFRYFLNRRSTGNIEIGERGARTNKPYFFAVCRKYPGTRFFVPAGQPNFENPPV